MNRKKEKIVKKIGTLVILSMLLITNIVFFVISDIEQSETSVGSYSLIPHSPISITSDEDFVTYGFQGNGTADNPYIIEGLNITTTQDQGIGISLTSKFFIIRNCHVEAESSGIAISGVVDSTASIVNNTCINTPMGIVLSDTSFSIISNNTCLNNEKGIVVLDAPFTLISNNKCIDNNFCGIKLTYSDSSVISDNEITKSEYGIYTSESPLLTITNNTCYKNTYSVLLRYSSFSTINNNTCTNNKDGIKVIYSRSVLLTNNTCNFNERAILIVYDSQNPALTQPGNVILRNNNCANNNLGIWLEDAQYSVLTDNRCYENNKGICLLRSSYSTVTNNTCNNSDQGLILDHSGHIPVVNNSFHNNNRSIVIYNGGATLTNNTMIKGGITVWHMMWQGYRSIKFTKDSNWVNGRLVGYFTELNDRSFNASVYGQLFFIKCKNITVSNQNFTDVTTGLLLAYSESCRIENSLFAENVWGTYLDHTLFTTLTNNSYKNNNYGVLLRDSDSNILTYNLFEENEQYGVYLYTTSSDNLIHHNAFINNNLEGTSQAYDAGVDNSWYFKCKGNYWSDYEKGNYLIDGIANSTDHHPLTDIPTASTPLSSVFIVSVIILACIVSLRSTIRKRKKTKNCQNN
jgi:parallel beta-helix repeat protein